MVGLVCSGVANLFAWIPSLPYAYFEVLRIVTFASSLLLCVLYFRLGWYSMAIGFLIALIDNPIARFHFGRETWNIIDAVNGFYCVSMSIALGIRLNAYYRSRDRDTTISLEKGLLKIRR